MATPLNTIFSWFETGDFPTQAQFQASWSSFWHKDDSIPISQITGLTQVIEQMVSSEALQNHINDSNAHAGYLAKLDASNLTTININSWKEKLGVGEIPANVALVDMGENQSVFNKDQITAICMLLENYVNSDGKIMSGMIEALGLTELISVTETSLSAFIANNAAYEYEKNDIIAIPNGSGDYSLYIYNGAGKNVSENYLPTGLTNITIGMVEGLQAALDSKLSSPTAAGNYFINHNVTTGYRAINPAANYLLFWNNTDFAHSTIYNNSGKYGIGTTTPSEVLHLNDGRLRSKALVFDENSETLPYQITHTNRRYYGSDLTGAKRMFMYRDFDDYKALWQNLTEAEKTEIKTIANGGWTTASMSVGQISPPILDKSYNGNTWVVLKGANLNLNPASFSVEIMENDGVTVIETVPNSQVQLYANGTDLIFYFNFSSYPLGLYKIRLWNGVAYYTTSLAIELLSSITPIDFSGLTYDIATHNNNGNPYANGSNGALIYKASADTKPLASESLIVCSQKSSAFIGTNEDFYLEFNFTVAAWGVGQGNNSAFYLGIMNASLGLSLANQSSAGIRLTGRTDSLAKNLHIDNLGTILGSGAGTITGTCTIIRRGASFTIIVTSSVNSTPVIYNKTNGTYPMSIYMANSNTASSAESSMTVVNAYKLS